MLCLLDFEGWWPIMTYHRDIFFWLPWQRAYIANTFLQWFVYLDSSPRIFGFIITWNIMKLSFSFGMVELGVDTLLDLLLCWCPVTYVFILENETKISTGWSCKKSKWSTRWSIFVRIIHPNQSKCRTFDFQDDFGWDTDDRFGSKGCRCDFGWTSAANRTPQRKVVYWGNHCRNVPLKSFNPGRLKVKSDSSLRLFFMVGDINKESNQA